jgi:hypothetical protein
MFAAGIIIGALVGWYVGSRGTRATRAWKDHRVAVVGAKTMGARRWVDIRAALFAWVVFAFVIGFAISQSGQ